MQQANSNAEVKFKQNSFEAQKTLPTPEMTGKYQKNKEEIGFATRNQRVYRWKNAEGSSTPP